MGAGKDMRIAEYERTCELLDAWIAAHEKAEETLSQDLDNFIAEMLDLGFDGDEIREHVHRAYFAAASRERNG